MLLNLTNWIGLVVPRKLFICFDHNVIQVEKVDFETIFLGKEDLDHLYSMAYIFNLPSIPLQLSNCINIFTSRTDIVKWYFSSTCWIRIKNFFERVLLCFNFSHSKPPTPSIGIIYSMKVLKEFTSFSKWLIKRSKELLGQILSVQQSI